MARNVGIKVVYHNFFHDVFCCGKNWEGKLKPKPIGVETWGAVTNGAKTNRAETLLAETHEVEII